MPPQTPRRPVMDVTARRAPLMPQAPAPAAEALIHEPPQDPDVTAPPASSSPAAVPDTPKAAPQAKPADTKVEESAPVPHAPTGKKPSSTPIGTIVATLFIMFMLSALAVAAYLKS